MARKKNIVHFVVAFLIGVYMAAYVSRNPRCTEFQVTDFSSAYYHRTPRLSPPNSTSKSNLLFVGVMTAKKYLDTRAKAVYETWGHQVPGRIQFFSSEGSYSPHIPVVGLLGVDDSYPPQKKSFLMLQYIHDRYLDKYEWFLRADDDVYVRMDRLEPLLRSVDSRKPWFIGQAGRGNDEEFGLLSLDNDENFCMGGPGIIISRETLRRIAPFINECLNNLYTNHEDVELGRCVKKFAGVSCTWSYEMQAILYHNHSGDVAFSGDLKQKEVHKAITMHPIKRAEHMYRLHNYVKGLRIQTMHQEAINLHRDISMAMQQIGRAPMDLINAELVVDVPLFPEPRSSKEFLGDPETLGVPLGLNRFHARELRDVLDWELISKSLYSYKDLNPRRKLTSPMREGINDVIREVMEIINLYSKQRGRIIDFKELFYGYWRLNPLHGADLILDLLLVYRKYRGHKMTVPVRRHAYIQQTFTGLFIKELEDKCDRNIDIVFPNSEVKYHKKIIHNIMSKIGENLPNILFTSKGSTKPTPIINFILPLSARFQQFHRFLKIYEEICLIGEQNTRLIIIIYIQEENRPDFDASTSEIRQFQQRHPYEKLKVITVSEPFNRGKALQRGVSECENKELMLFIDVDMVFNENALLRLRKNTVINKTVYFPMVFSLYKPNNFYVPFDYMNHTPNSEFELNERTGFWRQFGFGIVSLYKSDFINLGGFNTSITGWGLEDVNLFDAAVKSKDLRVVRAADPGLVHIYHVVDCESSGLNGTQKNMCIGTKASTYSSLYDLQNKYLQIFKRIN